MEAAEAMLQTFAAGAGIAGLTWFFSSRPRLFLRVFVPRDHLFAAGRHVLRRAEFRRGMRLIAGLQLGGAGAIGLVELWLSR